MLNMSKVKKESNSSEKTHLMWKQLLNNSQIMAKNITELPTVKTCHLRMTYSKLQSLKKTNISFNNQPGEKMRVSFLLQNQKDSTNSIDMKDNQGNNNIFNFATKRLNVPNITSYRARELTKTMDVKLGKRNESQKQNSERYNSIDLSERKSEQFRNYFKQIVTDHRANFDLSKMCSEGKCINITDRNHFESLQRVKLSLLNRKIEQKQKGFRCVSTKLNHYKLQNENTWMLPGLARIYKKKAEQKQKRLDKIKKQMKEKQEQKSKQKSKQTPKKSLMINSFEFQPWESNSLYNDEEDH